MENISYKKAFLFMLVALALIYVAAKPPSIANVTYKITDSAQMNCFDAIQNQDETDIDCGGSLCQQCSNGQRCLQDSDCLLLNCINNICTTTETPSIETEKQMLDAIMYIGIIILLIIFAMLILHPSRRIHKAKKHSKVRKKTRRK